MNLPFPSSFLILLNNSSQFVLRFLVVSQQTQFLFCNFTPLNILSIKYIRLFFFYFLQFRIGWNLATNSRRRLGATFGRDGCGFGHVGIHGPRRLVLFQHQQKRSVFFARPSVSLYFFNSNFLFNFFNLKIGSASSWKRSVKIGRPVRWPPANLKVTQTEPNTTQLLLSGPVKKIKVKKNDNTIRRRTRTSVQQPTCNISARAFTSAQYLDDLQVILFFLPGGTQFGRPGSRYLCGKKS